MVHRLARPGDLSRHCEGLRQQLMFLGLSPSLWSRFRYCLLALLDPAFLLFSLFSFLLKGSPLFNLSFAAFYFRFYLRVAHFLLVFCSTLFSLFSFYLRVAHITTFAFLQRFSLLYSPYPHLLREDTYFSYPFSLLIQENVLFCY